MKTNENMKNLITSESVISVHFNDEKYPTKMQFSTMIGEQLVILYEQGADSNDLEEIKEIANSGSYYEKNESLYFHTYDVKNSSLGTPFLNSEIPSHYSMNGY
jgi:hypothetical protein